MGAMPARLRHYLVLGVAAVLLSTGSAYAGGALARNSVGSVQVRDNSLLTNDIRNRTLRRDDLALGQVPRTYTIQRELPEGRTRVLSIPGFSRFVVDCRDTSITLDIGYGDGVPDNANPVQQHGLMASDIGDNAPRGGITTTGRDGGIGFSSTNASAPAGGVLIRGDYWGRSNRLLAHGTFSWGFPGAPCRIRLQLVVQEQPRVVPVPMPRARPGQRRAGGTVCEQVGDGSAFCR